MKKRSSSTVLSLLVGLSAMVSVALCIMQIHYSRELRSNQAQLLQVNNNRNMMNRLAAELQAYSNTNAAIKPLLQSVGIPTNSQ